MPSWLRKISTRLHTFTSTTLPTDRCATSGDGRYVARRSAHLPILSALPLQLTRLANSSPSQGIGGDVRSRTDRLQAHVAQYTRYLDSSPARVPPPPPSPADSILKYFSPTRSRDKGNGMRCHYSRTCLAKPRSCFQIAVRRLHHPPPTMPVLVVARRAV